MALYKVAVKATFEFDFEFDYDEDCGLLVREAAFDEAYDIWYNAIDYPDLDITSVVPLDD